MRGGGGGGAWRAPGAAPWEPPRAATRVCGGPSQPAEPLLCPQDIQHTEEFLIKPESRVAQLDTSQWPLLLKVRGGYGGKSGLGLAACPPPALCARLRRCSARCHVRCSRQGPATCVQRSGCRAGGGVWVPDLTSSPPASTCKKNFIKLTSVSWGPVLLCAPKPCI